MPNTFQEFAKASKLTYAIGVVLIPCILWVAALAADVEQKADKQELTEIQASLMVILEKLENIEKDVSETKGEVSAVEEKLEEHGESIARIEAKIE